MVDNEDWLIFALSLSDDKADLNKFYLFIICQICAVYQIFVSIFRPDFDSVFGFPTCSATGGRICL